MDSRQLAQDDFERAYRKGFWRKLSSWLTGARNELLPFDAVRERIPIHGQHYLGLRQVPVEQIVGSLGRYRDFDRAFLPRQARTRSRWVSIDSAHYEDIVLPPVDLFKIGEIYFVRDGNHRVSVARERGQEFVDAYVVEIEVPVPLTADMDLNDLQLKAEYANFIEKTHLDQIRPQARIELTLLGEYERLLEHINVHRWFLGEGRGNEVPFEEAVASWYDTVYLPMVTLINDHDLLEDFPNRSEADLYLWIIEYEWFLREAYRKDYSFQEVSNQFKERFSDSPSRRLVNVLKNSGWVDNLIMSQEHDEFLTRSGLEKSRPEAKIEVTVPGQYSKLLEHIDVHRWYLGEQQDQEILFEDAAASWYDNVYSPLVEFICSQNILADFPGRTEADLYIWILGTQASIRDIYGKDVSLEEALGYLRGKK
ncbi:MAG: hypothetical protein ACK2UM_07505 [Anaerolineales bacterium]|jgi:uncharacterized ParB-like nuclease family protein